MIREEIRGALGVITLDRPEKLNTLTLDMVEAIHAALKRFADNAAVKTAVFRSDLEKAFCAGGDIRAVRDWVMAGEHSKAELFFEREYALNLAIADYRKPIVSLINGFCLGGGCGLAIHGRYRVVSETARLGMPETAIGFFPDVGGSYFLSRLEGGLGLYLGLTGTNLDAQGARASGLATHICPADQFDAVMRALSEGEDAEVVLSGYADQGVLPGRIAEGVARYFSRAKSASELLANLLDAGGDAFAEQTLSTLQSVSPSSLSVTFSLQQKALNLRLDRVLALEFAAARDRIRHPDFIEGVRARLVDKEVPRWAAT